MTEPEFTAAVSSGAVSVSADDSATAEPEGGAAQPVTPSYSLSQFLPILLALQSTQNFLTTAPTFVPQTFQDQIQFVYAGGVYYLYLYINNQWSALALSGSSSTSINGFSVGPQNTLPSGVNTKVQFSTNQFANGVTWDGTNYQFVIVTAGQYLITGEVDFGSAPASSTWRVQIFINGSYVGEDVRSVSGSNPVSGSVTYMADLSVGDKITLSMGQNSGFPDTIAQGWLGIAKI